MRPGTLLAVAAACACLAVTRPAFGAQAAVSAESRSEAGLSRAFFHLPQGTIRVNYPDDAAAGDSISGTVYFDPAGSNQQQLDRNGAEVSGYVVEMPGEQTAVSSVHFLWHVPASLPSGLVPIVLRDRSKRMVAQCTLPVRPAPLPPAAASIDLPLGGQAGSPASAWGAFNPGSGTAITVGGKDAPVIAESPRKVIFQVPPEVAGETEIEARNGGLSARGPFRSLGLKLSATSKSMATGTTTTMTVLVSGLQGLKEPASLVIVNHEPTVVNLSGGAVQQLVIAPADVRPGGTFELTRTLTGERGGGYNLAVVVSLPPTSQLPLPRIAARTLDSWSRSSKVEIAPEAQGLILSGIAEARSPLDTLFRAQLAFHAEPASLLDWLVRDYCFDLRDLKLHAPSAAQIRPPRPGFALTFARPAIFAAESGAAISLQASDVKHFSFLQYIADFLARHAPTRPLGSLLVTSQPDQQLIIIDETTGSDYFTARMFVVSVGEHTVRVANCQDRVTVNPNQQATLKCPH